MGIRAWWRRWFVRDVQTVNDDQIIQAYVLAGGEFGHAVSYIFMGECIGFDALLDRWEEAERAYASLGYQTLSIDDFTRFGGYGSNIEQLLRVPRKVGDEPVYHAAYYREHYFGKRLNEDVTVDRVVHGVVQGTYALPSTDHLKEH